MERPLEELMGTPAGDCDSGVTNTVTISFLSNVVHKCLLLLVNYKL